MSIWEGWATWPHGLVPGLGRSFESDLQMWRSRCPSTSSLNQKKTWVPGKEIPSEEEG